MLVESENEGVEKLFVSVNVKPSSLSLHNFDREGEGNIRLISAQDRLDDGWPAYIDPVSSQH